MVQVVAGVVIENLLGIVCSRDIVIHGGLVEVLLNIGELKQQRNWSGMPYEMNRIDVACDLAILSS